MTDAYASAPEEALCGMYSLLGIAPGEELTRKVSLAVEYLQKDRERYIEIHESGVIGKTVPIAQRVQVSTVRRRRHTEIVTKISDVELLVAGNVVAPILRSYEVGRSAKGEKLLWFTCQPYTGLVPDDPEDGYEAKDPAQIRPIASETERAIQAALMDVFPKFASNESPNRIRSKVECAILAIGLNHPVKIMQNGVPVWGKLLCLARARNSRTEERSDCRVSSTQYLMLFVTGTDHQFLLQTAKTYAYFRQIHFSDDAPEEYMLEPAGTRCRRSYRPISPDEIGEGFVSCI